MKLLVLYKGYKKHVVSKKPNPMTRILKRKAVAAQMVQNKYFKFQNIQKTNKPLHDNKYDEKGNQVKINLNNIKWRKDVDGKDNKTNRLYCGNPVKTFNYYGPLDDSPTEIQNNCETNINKKMMENSDDSHAMAALNDYVTLVHNDGEKTKTSTNEDNWQIVGERQREKQRHFIHENNSAKYLPKTLLPISNTVHNRVQTSKVIALNIKIRPQANNKQYLHKSRVLIAIMRALQLVDPVTYLASYTDHSTTNMISDVLNITTDENDLDNYICTASDGRQFSGKFYIHTNNPINHYKQCYQFRNYLAKENIVVEENTLTSVKPSNVGFLETTVPRYETIALHTQRLLNNLPPECPKFQLSVTSLFAGSGPRCRILMMRANPEDVSQLQYEMNKLHEQKKVQFFHWGEYVGLNMEQKTDIINHQNKWNDNVRSLVLGGFSNTVDKSPMKTKDITMENETNLDIFYTIKITEYFKKHVFAGNGTNLFAFVYPPISGTFEFLVTMKNESEAKDYLRVAVGELTKRMSPDIIDKSFINTETAIATIHLAPWKPYSRSLQLLPEKMPTGERHMNSINGKRTRNEDSYIENTSYASVTRTSSTKSDSISIMSTESNAISDIRQKIELFQKRMDEKLIQQLEQHKQQTMVMINEKNSELKKEITEKIETTNNDTNSVLTNLTKIIMSLQSDQREGNRNMNTLMNRLGVNNTQEDSIDFSYDEDMKGITKSPETQTKIGMGHQYNTRQASAKANNNNNLYEAEFLLTQPEDSTNSIDNQRNAQAVTTMALK